jgi:PTH2 family peptidyl-tRNA hydrolase
MASEASQSPAFVEALGHLLDLEIDSSAAQAALQTVFEPAMTIDDLVEAALVVLTAESGSEASEASEPMKVVVAVRADLGMSIGKTAAQVGHGIHVLCREAASNRLDAWESSDSPIIVVQVPNLDEFNALIARCSAAAMSCFPIEDAGRTEIEPGTLTVVAVGPGTREELQGLTGSLKLLK